MKHVTRPVAGALAFVVFAGGLAFAAQPEHSLVGASGYDVVAYHTEGEARRGSGFHVAEHEGVTYAFASEENAERFKANPERYVPAYGGYCAYGAALGKKFVADPEVFEVVDGRLFLNLDRDIQAKWNEDQAGHIAKADANWPRIEDKRASEL